MIERGGRLTGFGNGNFCYAQLCIHLLYVCEHITRGEREFRACWPSILGVLFLDPRPWILVFGHFLGVLILAPKRFLKRFIPGFSFLAFGSWALPVLGVTIGGSGGFIVLSLEPLSSPVNLQGFKHQ